MKRDAASQCLADKPRISGAATLVAGAAMPNGGSADGGGASVDLGAFQGNSVVIFARASTEIVAP